MVERYPEEILRIMRDMRQLILVAVSPVCAGGVRTHSQARPVAPHTPPHRVVSQSSSPLPPSQPSQSCPVPSPCQVRGTGRGWWWWGWIVLLAGAWLGWQSAGWQAGWELAVAAG